MPASQARALRVMVTRPERDARSWVEQLRQNGFDAQALPLIEIAPLPVGFAVVKADKFDAFMFVSGNAVEHFLRAVPPGEWSGKRFMAPGPGTAAVLGAHGIAAGQIDVPPVHASQFDSEALWQLVGHRQWSGLRVLIVRGANHGDAAASGSTEGAGRDWFAQKLREAGAEVEFTSVYERRAPALTRTQLELVGKAAVDSSVWLFSSSEAVLNLTGSKGMPGCDWSRALAIATHPRIAETVRAAGWGVVVESRPALADIVTALRSIESGIHE
ncbi:MAG: uroporphyrinogen-III synthase [Polaromonas sp.]|uniref:uroporphyrinogen-III synthase n=1 Tax=Polaromonas sp. TaxID=1869339 RepID=UPI0025EA56BF|nr:uroporphyrinogen-III synthase [Polaromonas sp.]MBI2728685.1 uroporphyrinogen-III synthase [Polaromonas sp.]